MMQTLVSLEQASPHGIQPITGSLLDDFLLGAVLKV
jgi:hypothetical protein